MVILADTVPYRRAVRDLWSESKQAACIAVVLGALSQLAFPTTLFASGVVAALIGRAGTLDAILVAGGAGVVLTISSNFLRRRLQGVPRQLLAWQRAAAQCRLERTAR